MARKEEITLDTHEKFFVKDGKYFIQKDLGTGHRVAFVQVNKKEYDALVKKIAKRLAKASRVTIEEVLEAALREASLKSLKDVEKALNKGKTFKKSKGCLELVSGKTRVLIAGGS